MHRLGVRNEYRDYSNNPGSRNNGHSSNPALSDSSNNAAVVVIGHAPGSRWSWYAAEDKGVEAAWEAGERQIRRRRDVEAFQHFQDYAGLEARLANQGSTSLERISPLRGQTAITIPMPYRLALL